MHCFIGKILKNITFFSVPALVLLMSATVQAQSINAPTTEPGQIEKRFKPRATPRVSPDIVAPQQERRSSTPTGGPGFTLKSVSFQGNSAISDAELREAAVQHHIGTKVTFETLNHIVQSVTAHYRNQGYILARAVLERQRVSGGNVGIRIVEGYINKVILNGEIKGREKLLRDYANMIEASKPLKSGALERYLLLMDDLPGVTARGVLRPASTSGAADLVVTIGHKDIDATLEVNNRGTKFIGPYQGEAAVVLNSILGLYDRTMLRAIATSDTEELTFFELTHTEQIGSEGTNITGYVSRSDSEPGSSLKPLAIENENISAGLEVQHPFIRTRKENLSGRAAFDFRDTETDSLGVQITEDGIRALRVGGSYDIVDQHQGVNFIDLELSQGLDVLDAKDGLGSSRANGNSNFTKVNLETSRFQPLPNNFGLLVSAAGQVSNDSLPASEEYGLGGEAFGRAYDPAEIAGDHAASGLVELQWANQTGLEIFNSYQLYGFYDVGAVWNDDAGTGEASRQTLASTGAGVRFNVTQYLSGYAEVSLPMTRDVASADSGDGDDPRFFFSVVGRF